MNKALFVFLAIACACSPEQFREKPIVWDEERMALSEEYMAERHGIEGVGPYITPRMVVVHWTAMNDLEKSHEIMYPAALPGAGRGDIASASALNVGAHFLVDRDGSIYRQLPDTAFARHVIGLNYLAVGIENVGSDDALLTKEQLKANETIIRYLHNKYPLEYMIGHHEYNNFRGTTLFKETDESYRTEKTDPGDDFMQKLRENLRDLNLKKSAD